MIARDKKYLARLTTREQWRQLRDEGDPKADPPQAPLKDQLAAGAALTGLVGQPGAICMALEGMFLQKESYRRNNKPVTHHVIRGPWKPLTPLEKVGVWTDDYAPLLQAFTHWLDFAEEEDD